MAKRFFSLQEARQLLPRVREFAARMVRISGELEALQDVARALAENNANDAGSPAGTVYVKYLLALQIQVQGLQELGCVVKGVQQGLVDFPHLKNGREVYLCWQLGEDDIGFWHEIDSGFAGRTPLLD
jgi:hypothetical protein